VKNSQKKIGITGNIGSGKSSICHIFEALNIPVYYADIKAKELINKNPEIISVYKKVFGNDIFFNGQLNTKSAAEKIFKQKEILNEIEAVVHPAVIKDFMQWSENQQSLLVIYESAILFESRYYDFLNKIIFISAPENLRIKRVMNRDNVSKNDVINRINNQWSEEKKISLCDYVIVCNDVIPVIPQVIKIYNDII
jgi:dephospho-CoA kinase